MTKRPIQTTPSPSRPRLRALAAAVPILATFAATTTTLLISAPASATWLPGWASDGAHGPQAAWCNAASDKLYLGDFDGNGHTDLLCHNVSTGRRQINFAFESRRGFWGSNWDSYYDPGAANAWCNEAGALVFVGDYNGDGRDDLLCFKPRLTAYPGRKRIDFAEPGGWLRGTDNDSPAATWCIDEGESIHVGDYDGDGRDDLLCRVAGGFTNAGRKRIDYANALGLFKGTDFDSLSHPATEQHWCTSPGMSVYVGDFNGDSKDDLLCHIAHGFTNAGRRRIDFAGAPELPFEGTDFNSATADGAVPSWCATSGDNLRIGDVNGDGKDDLVCANGVEDGAYRGIRVDHANSAGTFYGTNGQAHHENWCTNLATSSFYTGDFDGDDAVDVLCHDRSSGYRAIRYANSGGDFHSVCSDDSTVGDGELPPLPVHFAVVSDPGDPDVPLRHGSMPTDETTHIHPITGLVLDQGVDESLFFRAEVEVMNLYTRTYAPYISSSVCYESDCVVYDYESHALYEDVEGSSCTDVFKWSNYEGPEYAPNCRDVTDPSTCHPNPCGGPYSHPDDAHDFGFACAIRQCTDPLIHKPQALNVVIWDRCDWDDNIGGISDDTCSLTKPKGRSFGLGGQPTCGDGISQPGERCDYFTGWDYERMLRGTHVNSLPRAGALGLEQHELGHVLDLGHTYDCAQNRNAMDRRPSTNPPTPACEDDGETSRASGYSDDIEGGNQLFLMAKTARRAVKEWSCH